MVTLEWSGSGCLSSSGVALERSPALQPGRRCRPMRLTRLLPLLGLLATGCSNNPVAVAPSPTRHAWIGSYTDASGQGDMVVDLTQIGSALSGEIVFGSSTTTYLRISGTMRSDSMILALDPAHSSNPSDFSLRAQVHADVSLSGTMTRVYGGLDADLSCRELPRRAIGSAETPNLALAGVGKGYAGGRVWPAAG